MTDQPETPKPVNMIASALLALTAVVALGIGVERILFWLSPPAGSGISPGPLFGVVVLVAGLGVGAAARAAWRDGRWGWIVAALTGVVLLLLAYTVWSTPGTPALPLPLTVGMALVGLALMGLVIARTAGFGRRTGPR